MMSTSARELLRKYARGEASAAEKILLERWYLQQSDLGGFPDVASLLEDQLLSRQQLIRHIQKKKTIKLWPKIAVAATILLCLSVGYYFLFGGHSAQQNQVLSKQQISPGGNNAILTLANGSRVNLTTVKNGVLTHQSGITVLKASAGQVIYEHSKTQDTETTYNTLSTPRGGQYQLVLADGSKVWLNAASSIKFPSNFKGVNRSVEITGEVYFEVAHDAAKPFRVITGGQEVEVLGTHFNVNAYADEQNIRTTLSEGSVRVKRLSDGDVRMIRPGEQTLLSTDRLVVANANIEETMAWKNGYFRFNDQTIRGIMRQISRWYNVDIEFEGTINTGGLNGKISRSKNIDQVLRMLERTGLVHFKIKERRIIVTQ